MYKDRALSHYHEGTSNHPLTILKAKKNYKTNGIVCHRLIRYERVIEISFKLPQNQCKFQNTKCNIFPSIQLKCFLTPLR